MCLKCLFHHFTNCRFICDHLMIRIFILIHLCLEAFNYLCINQNIVIVTSKHISRCQAEIQHFECTLNIEIHNKWHTSHIKLNSNSFHSTQKKTQNHWIPLEKLNTPQIYQTTNVLNALYFGHLIFIFHVFVRLGTSHLRVQIVAADEVSQLIPETVCNFNWINGPVTAD